MDIFTILLFQPIYNVLIIFYRAFGNDLGLAIIAVAILMRILLFPLTMKQTKMAESSKEFNTQLKELKEKHKDDKEKLNAEMVQLQSKYLPGQLNGCLSLIVQLIVIINIYNVVSNLFSQQGIETFNSLAYSFVPQFEAGAVINSNFLGFIDLQLIGNTLTNNFGQFLPYLVLAILAGASQYFSSKVLMGMRSKKVDEEKKLEAESKKSDKKKSKKSNKNAEPEVVPPDFAEIMERSNRQTLVIFSGLLVFMSLTLPAGLSLYWTVQSGLVIIQQILVERLQLWNQHKSVN